MTVYSTSSYEMSSYEHGWGLAPVKVNAGRGGSGSEDIKDLAVLAARRRAHVRALAVDDGSPENSVPADTDGLISARRDLDNLIRRRLPDAGTGDKTLQSTRNVGKNANNKQDASTELSMMFGNSATSSSNQEYQSMGYSKSVMTVVKRPYYGAGLNLDRLLPNSFTEEFAVAAYLLANATYSFNTSMNFINTWGERACPVCRRTRILSCQY